jgi:hypothetical protein
MRTLSGIALIASRYRLGAMRLSARMHIGMCVRRVSRPN